jgi:hypothetical protein
MRRDPYVVGKLTIFVLAASSIRLGIIHKLQTWGRVCLIRKTHQYLPGMLLVTLPRLAKLSPYLIVVATKG